MLVVTRKMCESFHIGPDILVKVVGVAGGAVRIGIAAPEHLRIWRDELPPKENKEPEHEPTY